MADQTKSFGSGKGSHWSWAVGTTLILGLLASLLSIVMVTSPAAAHAEVVQASPRPNSVVGGEFHGIFLQFVGLSETEAVRAEILDPAGTPIGSPAVRDRQQVVIPIEPLELPGTYTVSWTATGSDGDISSDLLTFRFDPAADPPPGITVDVTPADRLGFVGWLLIGLAAAVLGFLIQRFVSAWRDHKAARREPLPDESELADESAGDGADELR